MTASHSFRSKEKHRVNLFTEGKTATAFPARAVAASRCPVPSPCHTVWMSAVGWELTISFCLSLKQERCEKSYRNPEKHAGWAKSSPSLGRGLLKPWSRKHFVASPEARVPVLGTPAARPKPPTEKSRHWGFRTEKNPVISILMLLLKPYSFGN